MNANSSFLVLRHLSSSIHRIRLGIEKFNGGLAVCKFRLQFSIACLFGEAESSCSFILVRGGFLFLNLPETQVWLFAKNIRRVSFRSNEKV